jgi:hypothetical protein
MILKLLFLNKNKIINIEELKEVYREIIEFENNELSYNNTRYFFEMEKASKANNIILSISTRNSKNNLQNARLIESIKTAIINGKHRKNYRIITLYDDSSKYFCDKLSIIISKFERTLREFIYLTVILVYEGKWVEKTISNEIETSHKEKGVNQKKYIENALEEFSFYDYINYLFNKKEELTHEVIVEECLAEINKPNLDINRIRDFLGKSVKISLWDRLFYEYDIKLTKDNLEDIRTVRNKVMHNKNLYYDDFKLTKKLLTKLTKTLEEEILNINEVKYLENKNVTAVHTSFNDAFLKAIETSGIVKVFSENIKVINRPLTQTISDLEDSFIEHVRRQNDRIRVQSQSINNSMREVIRNLDFSQIIPTNEIREKMKTISEIVSTYKVENSENNELDI